jgi:Tesmin/TSO1-like CXC domain, cysteine-rich domain
MTGRTARPANGLEHKACNCKNSKCLKLYCECFASGRYCEQCNCLNCMNNRDNEAARSKAIETILERNPNAFRPKIQVQQVYGCSFSTQRPLSLPLPLATLYAGLLGTHA